MKKLALLVVAFAAILPAAPALSQEAPRTPSPTTPAEQFAIAKNDWSFIKSTFVGCRQPDLRALNTAMSLSLAHENARSQGVALTRDNFADMLREPREQVDALVSAHLTLFRYSQQDCAVAVRNMDQKLQGLLRDISPDMLAAAGPRSDVTVEPVELAKFTR